MRRLFIAIIALILVQSIAFADSSFNDMTARVILSGRVDRTADVQEEQLVLYMPQADIEIKDAKPLNYEIVSDELGNRLIKLKWVEPNPTEQYRIEMVVKTKEQFLDRLYPIKRLENRKFEMETNSIKFTEDVRKAAWPYETSLAKAFELTKQNSKTDAKTLAAMLRLNKIPTRVVQGYVYTNKFVKHSWVEVSIDKDGENVWIPFDSKLLRGGYLPANYIKFKSLEESSEDHGSLTWSGFGKANWIADEPFVEILDSKSNNIVQINSETPTRFVPNNLFGFVKANLTAPGCVIYDVDILSCVNERSEKLLDIFDSKRTTWFCDSNDLYWAFDPLPQNYICPITFVDNYGTKFITNVTIDSEKPSIPLTIDGPNEVAQSEDFELKSNVPATNGILFFSPSFNGRHFEQTWKLNIRKPGDYKFYLYANNSLLIKNVKVRAKDSVGLVVDAPLVTQGGFTIKTNVLNLLDKQQQLMLTIEIGDQRIDKSLLVGGNSKADFDFDVNIDQDGIYTLYVSAYDGSVQTFSKQISVSRPRSVFDSITSFFTKIANIFTTLVNSIIGTSQ